MFLSVTDAVQEVMAFEPPVGAERVAVEEADEEAGGGATAAGPGPGGDGGRPPGGAAAGPAAEHAPGHDI